MHPPENHTASSPARRCLGMLQRRELWLPSLRGWLVLLTVVGILAAVFVFGVYGFLARSEVYEDGVVAVEGWAGPDMLKIALSESRKRPEGRLYFTGGPIEEDSLLASYGTYADLGVAYALKLGTKASEVQAVPAPFAVRDRTWASALALKKWLQAHGGLPPHLTLVSLGAHSRRSQLLFQRAFGKDVKVGVLAVPDTAFGPHDWWRSSLGFRTVSGEVIAYIYAKLVFWKREG